MKLEAKNLKKTFENTPVIENVSIHMEEGEFVSLLGLSGSGKSTIFNMISGLLKPDGGQVLIDGEEWTGRTGRVSYMYQKDLLLPWRTIIDNAGLPLVLKGMDKKSARECAAEYFERFGLAGFEYKYPFQLSGGMRQRAALLRTYLFSRDIMLLDEPFGGLDAITRSKMQCWLLEILQEIKTSVLLITHDIEEAVFLSDRIYILSGRPATVKRELAVDIEKPRSAEAVTGESFNRIKRDIIRALE